MADSYVYQSVDDEESVSASCMDKHSSNATLQNYSTSTHRNSESRRLAGFTQVYWLHAALLFFNVAWTLLILYRPTATISTSDLFDVPCECTTKPFQKNAHEMINET